MKRFVNTQVTELFRCECSSSEHQMVIDYWTDQEDEWKETYITIHLAKQPWHRRLWVALRYTFGYQCRYGAFEEIVMGPEKVRELANILNQRLKHIKK